MILNWKIPAVSAGGAFLLSLLAGLIGRVGFGTAILRGLMWALLFGGFAFGVDYLLRRFLPELFNTVEGETADSERTVDITIDEENPLHGEREDAAEEIPQMDSAKSADESAEDGLTEERDAPLEPGFGDDSEEVGELEQIDETGEAAEGETSASDQTEDTLPSFDAVETAFAASGPEERDEEQPTLNIDALGIEEDPATVARAVRTFMNKDQEG